MDVVLQPRSYTQIGEALPPVVVRLRTSDTEPEDALGDSTNLVAVATLIPGPNTTGSTDPAVLNTLLAGRRFDSIRPFSDDEADGHPFSIDMDDPLGVGYMYFDGLAIRQTGTYRIRITLIRIRGSSSDPPVAPNTGGASVQMVDSDPIVVQGSDSPSRLASYNVDGANGDDDDGGWLEVLRTIQERRRSRG
ncbi:hypothetical protein EJ04DRAFT_569619 [Polyplosphaeria fusca]|uniref:Velvet domain-containing protein n=1 Tax=Polyplosphaeria fusca TaxID=682080 RepID=A0A9P4UWY6_9PLEO|nr:hypothetical protein EJ04DRAFT_569619 [Polyplosphaeria fusca]